jgi:hypothetical protein
MIRKTSAAAAIIAFATVGSALFGGAALANDGNGKHDDKPSVSFTGGAGGAGGDVWQECKQDATAYNILDAYEVKADDVKQSANADNSCTAIGGAGGAGGAGADVDIED